ncbi:hypothetical protein SESBI_24438 [Sesbania bispinosa]|nr:hypothetical protein SESBI_24438 [Sesbania bispinosa]
MKQKPSFSSSSYSQGLNQKIKHAIKEFKKNGYQTSGETIQHRASSEYRIVNNEKEESPSLDVGVIQGYIKNTSSDETEARLMRRASSLNESMDRYIWLFEQSFSKDIKWHNSMSKSLKLANEEKDRMSSFHCIIYLLFDFLKMNVNALIFR